MKLINRTCSVDGCGRGIKSGNYCITHYKRHLAMEENADRPIKEKKVGRICSVPGCGKKHSGLGYCEAHYQRQLAGDLKVFRPISRTGKLFLIPKMCDVQGCKEKRYGKGLCHSHFYQEKKNPCDLNGTKSKFKKCSAPGCNRARSSKLFCEGHHRRNLKGDLKLELPFSQSKTGPENPNWKGGQVKDKAGRWLVLSRDHPYKNSIGYVFRSRLVVESSIGRYLKTNEVVHHRDHDRTNDSIDNLQVMTQSDHAKLHAAERARKKKDAI